MVIKAVFEELAVQHKVVKEIELMIQEHYVFASNTWALPISDIAKASNRPQQVRPNTHCSHSTNERRNKAEISMTGFCLIVFK